MISKEQVEAIKETIQGATTENYMGAYLAGLAAHIHLGEQKARIRARKAACAAIQYADEDINLDRDIFATACQSEYDRVMLLICSNLERQVETPQSGLILPAHMTKN